MTLSHSPTARILAAGADFDAAASDAVDQILNELRELDQWAGTVTVDQHSLMAHTLELYRQFSAHRNHDVRERNLRFQILLEALSSSTLAVLDDLITPHPRRRAMISGDYAPAYLDAQAADQWFRIRATGLMSRDADLDALLQKPQETPLRDILDKERAERLAASISHLFHKGPAPGTSERFYVREWTSPDALPEPIVSQMWLIIDRATNAMITETSHQEAADELCALLNRQPDVATLYAYGSNLALKLIAEMSDSKDSVILGKAVQRVRRIQRELIGIMNQLDQTTHRI